MRREGAVHGGGVEGEPAGKLLAQVGAGHGQATALHLAGEAVEVAEHPLMVGVMLVGGGEPAVAHERQFAGEVLLRMGEQVGEARSEGRHVRPVEPVHQRGERAVNRVDFGDAEQEAGVEVGDERHVAASACSNA